MKKVAFEAAVKKIEHISLVSGDKMTRLTLQFDSDGKDDLLDSLNRMHRADRNVAVALAEIGE